MSGSSAEFLGDFPRPIFADRKEAGCRLAERLQERDFHDPVILALPRGGVPIGFEVARALAAPFDLVLVRKIGLPFQPELAYGAVVDGDHPVLVVNPDVAALVHLPEDVIRKERQRALKEIERRRALYLADRKRPEIAGRTAIIVDDGIATGATALAALKAVRRAKPKSLVLAAPVAPPETVATLEREADNVVCLETPEVFRAIGLFYRDFQQVGDAEVTALLKASEAMRRARRRQASAIDAWCGAL